MECVTVRDRDRGETAWRETMVIRRKQDRGRGWAWHSSIRKGGLVWKLHSCHVLDMLLLGPQGCFGTSRWDEFPCLCFRLQQYDRNWTARVKTGSIRVCLRVSKFTLDWWFFFFFSLEEKVPIAAPPTVLPFEFWMTHFTRFNHEDVQTMTLNYAFSV